MVVAVMKVMVAAMLVVVDVRASGRQGRGWCPEFLLGAFESHILPANEAPFGATAPCALQLARGHHHAVNLEWQSLEGIKNNAHDVNLSVLKFGRNQQKMAM